MFNIEMWLQEETFAYSNEFITHEYVECVYLDINF